MKSQPGVSPPESRERLEKPLRSTLKILPDRGRLRFRMTDEQGKLDRPLSEHPQVTRMVDPHHRIVDALNFQITGDGNRNGRDNKERVRQSITALWAVRFRCSRRGTKKYVHDGFGCGVGVDERQYDDDVLPRCLGPYPWITDRKELQTDLK